MGLRPPWPKGVSGNPGGRPQGIKLTNLLLSILEEPTRSGKITKAELLMRQVVRQAILGNTALVKEIIERSDGKVPDRIAGPDGGVLKILKGVTADEL